MRPSEQQRGQAQLSLDLQTLRAVLIGGNPQLAASALAALQHAAQPVPVHSQARSAMRLHHHLQPLPSAQMHMNPTTSTPPAPPVTHQQLQLLMLPAQQQQHQHLLAQQHAIQHQHHQQLPRMHATMTHPPPPVLGTTTATTAAWPQDEDSVRHTEMSSLASAMVEAVLGPATCGVTIDTQTLDAPPPTATWTTHSHPQRRSAWSTSGAPQQLPARSMSPSFSLPVPMATLTQQQHLNPSNSTAADTYMPHPRSPVPVAEHVGETMGGELLPTPFGLSGSTAPFVTPSAAPATAPPSIAPGDGSPSSLSSACSSLLTGTGGSRSSDVLLSSSNSNLVAQVSVPLGGHTGRTGSEADTLFPPQRPAGTHLCKSLSQHRHDHRPAPPPALAVGSLHPDDPLRFKAPNQSRRQGRDCSGPPAAFAPPLLNAHVQQQLIRQLQEELADARRQLAEALQAQARCTCGSGGGYRQDARRSQPGGPACASGSKAEEPPAHVDAQQQQQQQQQQAEEEDMTAAAHAAAMRALLPMLGGAGGGAGAATKPSSAAIPSTNTAVPGVARSSTTGGRRAGAGSEPSAASAAAAPAPHNHPSSDALVACEVRLMHHSSKPPCAASATAADVDAANGEEVAHVRLDRTGSAPDPCEAKGGANALDTGDGDANAVPRPSAVQLRLSIPGALSGALAKHALGALVASNARANKRKVSGV